MTKEEVGELKKNDVVYFGNIQYFFKMWSTQLHGYVRLGTSRDYDNGFLVDPKSISKEAKVSNYKRTTSYYSYNNDNEIKEKKSKIREILKSKNII